jgi:hypothetical protein
VAQPRGRGGSNIELAVGATLVRGGADDSHRDRVVVQATLSRLSAGRTHIVQICTVEDGLIASCEEYIAPETKLG